MLGDWDLFHLNPNIYRLVVCLGAVAFFSAVLAFGTISVTSLYGCLAYVYRDVKAKYKPSSVLRERILVLKRCGVVVCPFLTGGLVIALNEYAVMKGGIVVRAVTLTSMEQVVLLLNGVVVLCGVLWWRLRHI